MMKRLKSNQAKLGYASLMIQVANFAVLLLAKTQINVDEFAFLLTQLAIASIVGSIATMRLEVLIYQQFAKMTYAAAAMPVAATLTIIAALYLGREAGIALGFEYFGISVFAAPMMLGLGLSLGLSFLVIQTKQINLLLLSRALQAVGLLILTALLAFGSREVSGSTVLFYVGMCYLVPAACVFCYFVARFVPDKADPQPLFIPSQAVMQRSASLTISTGLNSVYVSLPLLIAAATQTDAFVADFGLLLRCFTAPVNFIRQVIGQLYLAAAVSWSTAAERSSSDLHRLSVKAMSQSVALYLLIAPFLVAVLYFNAEALNITHFHIAHYLGLAVLGQCAINVISQVRIALSDEKAFLLFDAIRLVGLALGLSLLSMVISYAAAFCVSALFLYSSYILFIRFRIARYVV